MNIVQPKLALSLPYAGTMARCIELVWFQISSTIDSLHNMSTGVDCVYASIRT